MSQGELAEAISLTFQQVQKYERGMNRISASKLYEISRTLKTPIQYFFADLSKGESAHIPELAAETTVNDFLATPEGVELATVFPHIGGSNLRQKILDLLLSIAKDKTRS